MIWVIKDKEAVVKTCFSIFPKRIGNHYVWLSRYYKTWDYFHQGVYSGYVPHWFVHKDTALKYVEDKIKLQEKSLNEMEC